MASTTGQTTTSVPGSAAANEAGEPGLERRPRTASPVVPLPPNAPFLALQWQAIGVGAVTATQAQASSPERARHAFERLNSSLRWRSDDKRRKRPRSNFFVP